jgi:hypothetical protein
VTVVPYLISSDYFVSEQSFRDLEFWNKSVVRDALGPNGDAYAYTGAWFPKIHLAFDPKTGHATVSPTRWVVVSDKDTRFQLAGSVRLEVGDLQLSEPDEPWRAQWMSFGLYDDGWTRPGVTARIRIFPERGQRRAQMRRFAFAVRAPDDVARRPVRIVSDIDRWSGVTSAATMTGSIAVCVPAHGYTEIRLATPVSSTIPADLSTPDQPDRSRRGGVFFGETALAGEVGGACRTRT